MLWCHQLPVVLGQPFIVRNLDMIKRAIMVLSALLITLLLNACQTPIPKTEKHLFVLSGQSNMLGMDPAETFIPKLAQYFGANKIEVVKHADGGKPIRRWDKKWLATGAQNPNEIGDIYDTLLAKVKKQTAGQRYRSVTLVWMQGERDAREGLGDLYEQAFSNLLEQLKIDLAIDKINFVIGRLSDFDMKNQRYPDWTKIRQVQEQIANNSVSGTWVDTDDFNDGLNRKGKKLINDLHYSVNGYRELGLAFANKAILLVERNK